MPEGYVIFEEIEGELSGDSLTDRVVIIQATKSDAIVTNRFGHVVDRNRRGIIILFNRGASWEQVLINPDCFTSAQEDGGVYYPPELYVKIKNNLLYIDYMHGRYGGWTFTFRYQHEVFELIGYDQHSRRGPYIKRETSINYSTGRMVNRYNTNPEESIEEAVFKEVWEDLGDIELLRLSDIADFSELGL